MYAAGDEITRGTPKHSEVGADLIALIPTHRDQDIIQNEYIVRCDMVNILFTDNCLVGTEFWKRIV